MRPEINRIYQEMASTLSKKADRIFSSLLLFQWGLGVLLALYFSPRAWNGTESSIHPHLILAVTMGGILALVPLAFFKILPGHSMNKNIVACSQILFSTLFIHLTDGRIETHFHVFGSLAFLGMYRAMSPIWIATAITAIDHLARGYFWPESVYGVAYASPIRAIEHAAWVLFEVGVLREIIRSGQEELRSIAEARFKLESALDLSAKMSTLGEFMSGIAHEINNPIASISSSAMLCEERHKEGKLSPEDMKRYLDIIKRNSERVVKIVKSLKNFSRSSTDDPMEVTRAQKIADDLLEICRDSVRGAQIDLQFKVDPTLEFECHPSEIEQILVNLVANARDAISGIQTKWIRIEMKHSGESAELSVTDSGGGIPKELQENLMQPFYTTKPSGKGTGLGLSISRKFAQAHQGDLTYDHSSPNTRFVLRVPLKQTNPIKTNAA